MGGRPAKNRPCARGGGSWWLGLVVLGGSGLGRSERCVARPWVATPINSIIVRFGQDELAAFDELIERASTQG